ncbi:Crp/Fnr family transcriptional regulator [Kaarinaea lacus]
MGQNHGGSETFNIENWMEEFPMLQNIDPVARDILTESSRVLTKPAGSVIFSEGQPCKFFVLVLKGSSRIHKKSEDGNEVVLYRIKAGEACGLSMSSILTGSPCQANASAETETVIVSIPKSNFKHAMAACDQFSRMVLESLEQNVNQIVSLVGDTIYGRLDKRLAHRLLAMHDEEGIIYATHDDIASELGSAREVISRQLKEFEKQGYIRLFRGRIHVVNSGGLKRII